MMNINQVWPEWHEDSILGEGSFGKVYKAKRVDYGRTFYSAIKVITVPKSQQEVRQIRAQGMNEQEVYTYFRGIVDNLLNEISLMDNLKGANNIVGIEDYKIIEHENEIGWDIFIRMELLTPFDNFITNPEFSQLDVIKLGVDLCSALETCEQNYIVHRDIKPDNIFISKFGEYKLGDFGIARKLETTQANLSRKGTLNYMAPEVYKSEEYGSNVDIYSLGLVLYTLLNNNRVAFLPPFPQPISYSDNEEALSKRLSGMPLPLPCNASESLGRVIVKACSYWPQERYQSATEFKTMLLNEWNALTMSGFSQDMDYATVPSSNNSGQIFVRTNGGMTQENYYVSGESVEGTTILDVVNTNAVGSLSNNVAPQYEQSSFAGAIDVALPTSYSTVKSNKLCRVLAWPMAIVVCAFALVLMFKGEVSPIESTMGVSLLGAGLTMLFTDRNKLAVGLCTSAVSLGYVVEGLGGLLSEIQDSIPIPSIITLASGMLLFLAGIVIISQKEVRFGGSLCLYAFILECLFSAYRLMNNEFDMSLCHVFYDVAAVVIFIWSYGYKSDEKLTNVKKILHIVTTVLSGFVLIWTVVFAGTELITIF